MRIIRAEPATVIETTSVDQYTNEINDLRFDELLVDDKPLAVWEKFLLVELPTDPVTMESVQRALAEVFNMLNTAYYYMNRAERDHTILGGVKTRNIAGSIKRKTESSQGRLPSVNTLLAIAEAENQINIDQQLVAEIRLNFWRKQVDKLKHSSKLLESLSYLIGAELKLSR